MYPLQFLKQSFNKESSIRNLKYYRRWKVSLEPSRNSILDRLPWINFPATDFLNTNLKPQHKVFEYGGGGSTLYFLDRVAEVVTVEHNPDWFQTLQSAIVDSEKTKWKGNLILPESNSHVATHSSISDPDSYFSGDDHFRDKVFRSYASYIDRFEDGYFDVVLIDGRVRPSCIKHAVKKVKKNGLMVLDNAERKYYFEKTGHYFDGFKLIMNHFAPLPYVSHFTQTNIWVKT